MSPAPRWVLEALGNLWVMQGQGVEASFKAPPPSYRDGASESPG